METLDLYSETRSFPIPCVTLFVGRRSTKIRVKKVHSSTTVYSDFTEVLAVCFLFRGTKHFCRSPLSQWYVKTLERVYPVSFLPKTGQSNSINLISSQFVMKPGVIMSRNPSLKTNLFNRKRKFSWLFCRKSETTPRVKEGIVETIVFSSMKTK